MSYLDMNDEQMGIYPEPEIKALPKEIPWGLANTPTTLTVLGLSDARWNRRGSDRWCDYRLGR